MKLFQNLSRLGVSTMLLFSLFSGYARAGKNYVQPALRELVVQDIPRGCDPEAREKLLARANAGDVKAQHLIGMQAYLAACDENEDSNRKEAIYYLSKSAAQFHPPSMFHLAENLFEENNSHSVDVERFHLYLGAAERGFHKAEFNVAMYYFYQKSVVHDDPQAFAWLSQCNLHDHAFCTDEDIAAVRARMSNEDIEKAEQLKARLLEKMKDIPEFEDVYCCSGGRSGFGMRRE